MMMGIEVMVLVIGTIAQQSVFRDIGDGISSTLLNGTDNLLGWEDGFRGTHLLHRANVN